MSNFFLFILAKLPNYAGIPTMRGAYVLSEAKRDVKTLVLSEAERDGKERDRKGSKKFYKDMSDLFLYFP